MNKRTPTSSSMTLNKASYDEERKENIFNLAVPENSSRPT